MFRQMESESPNISAGGGWPSPHSAEQEAEVQRGQVPPSPLLSSRWITLWALHWWWASSSGFRRKPTLLQTIFQPWLHCSCCMGELCGPLANVAKGKPGEEAAVLTENQGLQCQGQLPAPSRVCGCWPGICLASVSDSTHRGIPAAQSTHPLGYSGDAPQGLNLNLLPL